MINFMIALLFISALLLAVNAAIQVIVMALTGDPRMPTGLRSLIHATTAWRAAAELEREYEELTRSSPR